MPSPKVVQMITEQIMKEFFSAYLYLDMAGYYNDVGLEGFENWFTVQAQEERDHAMLFRTYLFNNDAQVKLLPIPAPDKPYEHFGVPLDMALEHEHTVTASINRIYAEASADGDYRTLQFLDWFVMEQGEEEKNATDLIKKYQLFGGDAKGLYQLDQELGTRVYSPPTLVLD